MGLRTKKIKDRLPIVNGLWSHINYQFPEIFDIQSSQLDVLFLSHWSLRTSGSLIELIHRGDDDLLSSAELEELAEIINGIYKNKWDRMMAVATAEYDPIHNYNDHLIETIQYTESLDGTKSSSGNNSNTRTDNLHKTETDARGYTHTYNTTDTRTDNLHKVETDARGYTHTYNTTDTRTDNLSEEEIRNLSNSGTDASAHNVYGFNSATAVGESNTSGNNSNLESGSITTENTGTQASAKTGTEGRSNSGTLSEDNTGTQASAKTGTEGRTNSGTLTEDNTGTQTNAGTTSSSETIGNDTEGEKTREYTKSGNIGNISTQKLLNEELDLWKYNFIYEMMHDVAKFITIPIYEQ